MLVRLNTGQQVRTQRANYKDGKIAQGRIDQLNSIGFAFSLKESSPAESWDKRFNELATYRAEHGNSNIPVNSGKLGRWVSKQRTRTFIHRQKTFKLTPI